MEQALYILTFILIATLPSIQAVDKAYVSNIIKWEDNAAKGPMTCGATAAAKDVWDYDQKDLRRCGTVRDPCPVGMRGVVDSRSAGCNTCYIITARRDQVRAPECQNRQCWSYEKTIFTKVAGALDTSQWSDDAPRERRFDLAGLGWFQICPKLCKGSAGVISAVCVEETQGCPHGEQEDWPDKYRPGSGRIAVSIDVAWQKADCQTGAPIGGDSDKGGGQVGVIPSDDKAFVADIINWGHLVARGPMTCGAKATAKDAYDNQSRAVNKCGSLHNPCAVGMHGIIDKDSVGCNTCYIITARREVVGGKAECKDSTCPAYERTVLTKVTAKLKLSDTQPNEGLTRRRFDFAGLGWFQICPYICYTGRLENSSVCVEKTEHCTVREMEGNPNYYFPGSSSIRGAIDVAWQKADCQTGRAIGGDNDKGGGQVGVIPEELLTTTSTIRTTTTTTSATTSAAVVWLPSVGTFLLPVAMAVALAM